MKRTKMALTALMLALVMAVAPLTALAAPAVEPVAYEEEAFDPFAELRMVALTPEAMEIVLYDFDYLVAKIMAVAPTVNIIERRLGVDAEFYFEFIRNIILSGQELPSLLSVFEPERWGEEQTDPLYIAADYLFTVMQLITGDLGALGHFIPQSQFLEAQTFTALVVSLYHGIELTDEDIELWMSYGYTYEQIHHFVQSNLNFSQLHFDIYNQPSVLWFYELNIDDIDVNVNLGDVMGFQDENNIVTEILEEGRIAYIRINSFLGNIEFDSQTLFPFYEEIQDFEHLIIDIRGNGGGWTGYWGSNVMSMLLTENVVYTYYELFVVNERTAAFFEYPMSMLGGLLVDVITVDELLATRNLPAFNEDDAQLLDYAIIWEVEFYQSPFAIPFAGDIWLLVDGQSASASEMAANASIATGFATVVGEPTAGVTGVLYTFAAMPNTGILFRIDIGYTIDQYGRSVEEHGVIPQIANAPGLDALQTVMSMIATEGAITVTVGGAGYARPSGLVPLPAMNDVFATLPTHVVDGTVFVPVRLAAYAHGYSVQWDEYTRSAIITNGEQFVVTVGGNVVIYNDTMFIPLEDARELFA